MCVCVCVCDDDSLSIPSTAAAAAPVRMPGGSTWSPQASCSPPTQGLVSVCVCVCVGGGGCYTKSAIVMFSYT